MSDLSYKATLDVYVLTPVFIGGGPKRIYGTDIVESNNFVYDVDIACLSSYVTGRGVLDLEADINSIFNEAIRAYQRNALKCKPFKLRANKPY